MTRVINDYEFSAELKNYGFPRLSPDRLANLTEDSWFTLTYDKNTGARHLFCGYGKQ